ncbi:MAG: DUF6436 domain-containing protein [Saccharospirillum sp.]|nr:DUF6436 domain-containing protein [Saccharospirillum sp.]
MKTATRVSLGVFLILLAGGSVFWFERHYMGWFGESVDNMNAWQGQWQSWLDGQPELEHPAMVHLLPEDCLCRWFVRDHAGDLSDKAVQLGYQVYQTSVLLGEEQASLLKYPIDFASPGPLMILTNAEGEVRYLGPYSDGLRCNAETSLVDQWLPLELRGQVVQLDANGCVCHW